MEYNDYHQLDADLDYEVDRIINIFYGHVKTISLNTGIFLNIPYFTC
jgi:hypothetical protein